MPVSKGAATAQVRKFMNHPAFPDDAGQLALSRAFREACESDEHANQVGEYLVRKVHFAPVPGDVYQAVTEMRLDDAARLPEWKGFGVRCSVCQDTGWQVTDGGAIRCPECARAKVKQFPPKASGATS